MSRRWSPGSPEWIRVVDRGSVAVWVRPEDDGASIAVYLGCYYDQENADIWQVRVLRGSSLLDAIMDKPHRVRWVEDNGSWDGSGVVTALCADFKVVSYEHVRKPATHHEHPRNNYKQGIWLDPLPRRVREAIGYP